MSIFLDTFSLIIFEYFFSFILVFVSHAEWTHLNLSSLHRKSFSRMMYSRRLPCGGKHLWPLLPGSLDPTDSTAKSACGPKTWRPVQLNIPKNNSMNTCPNICSMHVAYACNTIPFLMICFLSVSEAPKEAPVRKYLPSSVYLEEKTDDQKKDEVSLSVFLSFVCSFILYTGCLFVCLCLWVIHEIGMISNFSTWKKWQIK